MRTRLLGLLLLLLPASGLWGQEYWQQALAYKIDVKLNDEAKTLDAFMSIDYHNQSPDTLRFIWFHLWPNAYKNDRTAFSDQQLQLGETGFYFSSPEQRGYINRLSFQVNGTTAVTEDHPQHIDIVKLLLPEPLAPGERISITTPFHVKLPYNFSRGGFAENSFQITQWYPKPAVYDRDGWHPMPYLDQGEFYSEFASFEVNITLPSQYVVAATGMLQHEDELAWMKSGANKPKPVAPWKTLTYVQDKVHDFAWFASADFKVAHDTLELDNRKIDVFAFFPENLDSAWKHTTAYAKDALRFYSTEVGTYPFSIASVVAGPDNYPGGMEYPTITLLSPAVGGKDLDLLIAHELGHNWFYGILANNERKHPWLDEGLNTFYTDKYARKKYGASDQLEEMAFHTKAIRGTDQPISTPSEKFSPYNYALVAYHKTSEWLQLLEEKMGAENFQSMMQDYYTNWKFRHPQPLDFKNVVFKHAGTDAAKWWQLIDKKGILPGKEFTGTRVVSPFKRGSIAAYINNPARQNVFLSPFAGYNIYNGAMPGIVVSNYLLPPNKLNYLLAPMYGLSSGSLAGLGRLQYSASAAGWIRKYDLVLTGARFAMNNFTDSLGNQTYLHFEKLVPSLRFTFREKNALSSVRKYLQLKTYQIREQQVRSARERRVQGSDTTYPTVHRFPYNNRYINQLEFILEDFRALYPYNVNFQLQQGRDFVRASVTGNYFFNYPKGGGLQLRYFGGKFFYTSGQSLNAFVRTSRYHFNMSGASGYDDYTYSSYFVGRNAFNNTWSRQMMMRDGGFKVQTELLGSKVGRSDNWLVAVNLTTTIPDKLNPLQVLPVKIPLRLYADIGTHAEPWQQEELNRILFNAGLNFSLFGDVLNIHLPLVFSKEYNDYFKSTGTGARFFRPVSFFINLYPKALRELNSEVEY